MSRSVFGGALAGLATVAIGVAALAVEPQDQWHQWRGPEANGFAARGNPPTEWSEEKNVKWKVAIPGKGSSTPIIWGDRLFILTAIKTDREGKPGEVAAPIGARATTSPFHFAAFAEGDSPATESPVPPANGTPATDAAPTTPTAAAPADPRGRGPGGRNPWNIPQPTTFHEFVVLCLDKNTGETLWQRTATEQVPHEGHHQTGSFAAGSPITDGKHVYCSFGSFGIFCYDMDGNLQWQKDLGDMRMRASFGEGASPALHGDTLVLNWDHEDGSKVYVLDARTGDVKWQRDRDEASTWNTPLVTEFDGRAQVILNGATRVRSYDLETGDLLWECGGQTGNPIPSPMRHGDNAICLSGFRGAAAYAIPLSSTGDLTDTDKIAWKHTEGTPYVSCAAIVGDRLWFTKDRAAIVSCVDLNTGEPVIDQKRLPALDDMYSSPVGVEGRVYFTGRNGATVVLDATKDEVAVLAENQLDEVFDASPAIVDDEIFLRGEKDLYCIAQE